MGYAGRIMAGILFVRTRDLAETVAFYMERVGMNRWLSQPQIEILQHENLLVGFHQAEQADTDALITFFYASRAEVDEMHARLSRVALGAPQENARYDIYNFYATDPDGRRIEFQAFLKPVPAIPAVPGRPA